MCHIFSGQWFVLGITRVVRHLKLTILNYCRRMWKKSDNLFLLSLK
jgi:hypothetical protein